ncbi:MAG: hypothetical protein U0L64_06660 [Clostridium sp.]|nr:hypothetical protein [Clostridium sp.]
MSNDNKKEKISLLPIFMCLGGGGGGLIGGLVFNQLTMGSLIGLSLALLASAIFDKKDK